MSCIVGICGGSCSGKTTVVNKLKAVFKEKAAVIYHDNYYISRAGLTDVEKAAINYDSPDALETSLLIADIEKLKSSKAAEVPLYDFSTHERMEQGQIIEPCPIILVDGIMIFENRRLASLFDLKVFVHEQADIRLARRILRDTKERGRDYESVITQYMSTVRPMHEKYVEPCRGSADMVVKSGEIEKIVAEIKKLNTEN